MDQVVLAEKVAASMTALAPMLSTLTGYARAMTGNPAVQVVSGHKTQTDGSRIMVRPPLALADLPEHERQVCGRRRETGELECAACAAREDILVKMRHEIGHLIHGSFVPIRYNAAALRAMADKVGLGSSGIHPPPRATMYPLMEWATRSPDPNIATLALVLEDVRVDRANASTSDGGAAAYRIFLERVMATGGDEGTPSLEHPLVGQVVLGMLSAPHGVDVEPLLGEEARAVLDDHAVSSILNTRLKGAAQVLGLVFPLYRRLIDLGVFPEPESQDEDEDEGQTPESGDGESGDQEGEPGGGGQQMDPEKLRELVEQATGHAISLDGENEVKGSEISEAVIQVESHVEHLGSPEPHMGQVKMYGRRRIDGPGPLLGTGGERETRSAQDPSEETLGALVGRARVVFAANAMVERQRNATRGRVAPTTLGKRAWNPEDQRLFERRQRNDAPSYSVLVGMDNSGSTVDGIIARTLRETALATATMCHRVGIEVSVYAHTTGAGQARSMDLYELKAPDEPWDPRLGNTLRGLKIGSTNFDGSTLRAYRRILAPRRATRKVLLYFTDGHIPGAGGQSEEQIMREEVAECRKRGVTLLGVGAHTSSPEDYGIPTVRLDSIADVRKVLEFLAKEFGV